MLLMGMGVDNEQTDCRWLSQRRAIPAFQRTSDIPR